MARTVSEINATNFVATGQTTPLPRYTFTLHVEWVGNDDVLREHGPQTYTYPNDLAAMPLAVRRAFAEKMIIATARVALGISTWEEYE